MGDVDLDGGAGAKNESLALLSSTIGGSKHTAGDGEGRGASVESGSSCCGHQSDALCERKCVRDLSLLGGIEGPSENNTQRSGPSCSKEASCNCRRDDKRRLRGRSRSGLTGLAGLRKGVLVCRMGIDLRTDASDRRTIGGWTTVCTNVLGPIVHVIAGEEISIA